MIPFAANAAATLQQRLHRRLAMLLNGPDNPRKLPVPVVVSAPHPIHGSLGLHESRPKWQVDRFSRFCTAHRKLSPLLYNAPLCFPPHCPFHLEIVTLPEEDRATAIGNMHRKIGKDRACGYNFLRYPRGQTDTPLPRVK